MVASSNVEGTKSKAGESLREIEDTTSLLNQSHGWLAPNI